MKAAFTSGAVLAAVVGAATRSTLAQTAATSAPPQIHVDPTAVPAPNEASALAEKVQNPIADLISLPFQNNAKRTQVTFIF